jgi:hypothetical protein
MRSFLRLNKIFYECCSLFVTLNFQKMSGYEPKQLPERGVRNNTDITSWSGVKYSIMSKQQEVEKNQILIVGWFRISYASCVDLCIQNVKIL